MRMLERCKGRGSYHKFQSTVFVRFVWELGFLSGCVILSLSWFGLVWLEILGKWMKMVSLPGA